MSEKITMMVRGNGLRKVPTSKVAAHEKHGWVKFESAGPALQAGWRSRSHMLDPSVAELIAPKKAKK